MGRASNLHYVLIFTMIMVACSSANGASPTPASTPTRSFATQPRDTALNDSSGEPRSPGYWSLWNSCASENRAETAAANGGRPAGWILMDDLLQDPGILLGEVAVKACVDGLQLLQAQPLAGEASPDDVAYPLAAQLLSAQLNLAAGAENCSAIEDAVRSTQLLLISAGFDGSSESLGSTASAQDRELAVQLTGQLNDYNLGHLCQ